MIGLSTHFLVSIGDGEHASGVHPHASALGPEGFPGAQGPLCSRTVLFRFHQLLWLFKRVEEMQLVTGIKARMMGLPRLLGRPRADQ